MNICDSCFEAFEDEGVDGSDIESIIEFGTDIFDHICDRIETEGEVSCDCPGHRN